LPASGGTPPFRCRSTGERCWTALPLGQRISPPRSGQRSGGVARSAEGARSVGPQGTHGGFLARFARAPPRLRRYSPVPLPLHGGAVLDGPAAGAEAFSPTKRSAEGGSGARCRGGAVRRTAGTPRWFPGSLRSRPSPPPAVLPRSAAAPRGRGVGRPCRWSRGFLPHEAVSGVGEWHEVPRGRGPQDRRETTVVSWLASLAPPPRLRRCSPVPLPLHGGEVPMPRYQVPSTRNGDMKIVVIGGTGYAGASIV